MNKKNDKISNAFAEYLHMKYINSPVQESQPISQKSKRIIDKIVKENTDSLNKNSIKYFDF